MYCWEILFGDLSVLLKCVFIVVVTFEQEHELRQIYIRSSARVYEVYYTKKRRNDKEYLCTVRCGIAIREEDVFQIPLVESDASKNRVEEVKNSIKKRVKNNGSGWTNEDDWVEVNNEKDLLPMLLLGKQVTIVFAENHLDFK